MHLDRIIFEAEPRARPTGPVRLDSVCFLGFVAERRPVRAGPVLTAWLDGLGLLTRAERLAGPETLIGRPVTVASLAEYEMLFDGATRIDAVASLTGNPLGAQVLAADLSEPLAIVLDGRLIDIALPALDQTPAQIAAAIMNQCPGLSASVDQDRRLTLSRRAEAGAGTLAVLTHPGLGFPTLRHARTRAVGAAMDVAVRQFFAMGGQVAHIVSMGPPLPLLASSADRAQALGRLMGLGTVQPAAAALLMATPNPGPADGALAWPGLSMLMAFEDAGMLLIPDLPDLVAAERTPAPETRAPAPRLAVFADCLPEPAMAPPMALADMDLPVTDADGAALWGAAVSRALRLISDHRRDMQLLAALPRLGHGVASAMPASAFLTLASPYLKTPFSKTLPGAAMAPDAVLAGQFARRLNSDTPFASAALELVPLVTMPAETVPDVPGHCRFAADRGATVLVRDVTTSDDPAWRSGTAQRIIARLLREAARLGDGLLFEPISEIVMHRVIVAFETVLLQIAAEGGLSADGRDPGFSVICDASTTPAADIERGILRAEVTFRPAVPIEEIRLSLPIGRGSSTEGRT
ncbi:MAG: hypothetical protein WCC66_13045 [Rhizobiaceae bacterium]